MSESANAFQFDSSPGQPWLQHPRFHRYWQHYHSVRDWYYSYWFTPYTLSAPQPQQYFSHPFNLPNPSHPHHNTFYGYHGNPQPWSTGSGQQGYPNQPGHAQGVFSQTTQRLNDQSEESSGTSSEEDVDNFEMEVSHEMKEFFAKSEKHRNERKKDIEELKQKIFTGEKQDYVNAEDMHKTSISTTSQAPSEKPGQKRRQEMRILYGKEAAMIHGMETAIQLQFDRNCDKKQPHIWPTIPLKF